MKLNEQVKYLRKAKGFLQTDIARMTKIGVQTYSKFEAGTRTMTVIRLERILKVIDGTLMIAPFRFNEAHKIVEIDYVVNEHGSNGSTMHDALEALKLMFADLPNLLIVDNIGTDTIKALEMYMTGVISKAVFNRQRRNCEERYLFYDERENSSKIEIEPKTKSYEMYAIEILKKACSKEFYKVPDMVDEFLREDGGDYT